MEVLPHSLCARYSIYYTYQFGSPGIIFLIKAVKVFTNIRLNMLLIISPGSYHNSDNLQFPYDIVLLSDIHRIDIQLYVHWSQPWNQAAYVVLASGHTLLRANWSGNKRSQSTLTKEELFCSGSANAQLPGCFRPWTLNFGLNMFSLKSFMACLHSLLGYSPGEFQALQLIVLGAFGVMDKPIAPCMLVHFLEI